MGEEGNFNFINSGWDPAAGRDADGAGVSLGALGGGLTDGGGGE